MCGSDISMVLSLLLVLGWILVLGAWLTLRQKDRELAVQADSIRHLRQQLGLPD